MQSFKEYFEAHHEFDDVKHPDEYPAIKHGDTFRVFHGFNTFPDAWRTLKYGISGKYKADRRYSYENNNNPKGIFVTLDLKTALNFVGSFGPSAAIEFNASTKDLENPVWPSGSYTVQGEREQFFKNTMHRQQARKDTREKFRNSKFKSVAGSDDPGLASTLYGGENQALFIGDLNPEDIVSVYVKMPDERGYAADPAIKLSKEEFFEKFKDYKEPPKGHDKILSQERFFKPNDNFSEKVFLDGFRKWYGDLELTDGEVIEKIQHAWHPGGNFRRGWDSFLWPKQMPQAYMYLYRKLGGKKK